ncbi:FtsX-like permease family protein [Micromonospora sp. KC213]|uniref:FtsX-like permease family protein n=1 Tax=Micromonospora sp. KC213 TaxID=2530378 RepID=UPI00104CAD1C|nr:FtsX-like permease family protein [Micromonospora sp. KC213]TDC38552.1 FtsX-like permease family protein [Micromonospora sp. KC213]
MKLVWRRARAAWGLLLAAASAALVAVALVTGLSDYSRQAIEAGQRAMLAAAPAAERSLLISGSGGRDAAESAARDATVRRWFADGLGGAAVTVSAARHGTGRELTGELGTARTDDEPVFADLATLDGLPAHADLVAGGWPTAGASPAQVAVPERVAGALRLTAGTRVPMTDRRSGQAAEVVVAGVFRPRDPGDAYWQLAPAAVGAEESDRSSYGPFVLDPADFAHTFPGSTSISWLAEPNLTEVAPSRLPVVKQAVAAALVQVPEEAGLGSSAQSVTGLDRLIDRLGRADLVGRSALLTPLLLIVVLGGYALLLVAALLNEDRRGQTALLRARGAARGQLAGLAVREAMLVVLPAALLAPPLADLALRQVGGAGGLTGTRTGAVWTVALAATVGCLLAMVLPALRRAGSYVADLAARSRPTRAATVQRAGVDLALVLLALLAWTQLRQHASPLAGAGSQLGIDPLLAVAPTLGVLAGAVLALRLLPPATRFAERLVDRRPWTATMFGMWQAGRRPHAGPVLLLALAVGASTLAWSLVSTWERSHIDQADHQVGADLRVAERRGDAPADRAARLADVPGVARVLPAWRDEVRLGRTTLSTSVLALDAAAAADVARIADRLADEPPRELLARMVRDRPTPGGVALPADARRLTGTVRTPVRHPVAAQSIEVTALLTGADGLALRLPLATTDSAAPRAVRFAVALPTGPPLRLAGFQLDAGDAAASGYRLQVDQLRVEDAGGAARPVALTGDWALLGTASDEPAATRGVTAGGVDVEVPVTMVEGGPFANQPTVRFAVVPAGRIDAVPALVTPAVLAALDVRVGDVVPLALSGASLPVRVVGQLRGVPGAHNAPGAMLVDLPAAVEWLVRHRAAVRPVPEWWLRTDPDRHADAATAVGHLPDVTVLDRWATAEAAARDPYWRGARTGLLAAALGSVLLALVGLAVDVWATGRRRIGELAVLHTLGAGPPLLTRALLAEQTFLAGIGVAVGLLVGAAVGATMAPLVILTPAAGRPVPEAAFTVPWTPIGLTAAGLLAAALVCSAMLTTGLRQRLAAVQVRIGGER